jgi:tetratricopeptide (TPR) repeat protein
VTTPSLKDIIAKRAPLPSQQQQRPAVKPVPSSANMLAARVPPRAPVPVDPDDTAQNAPLSGRGGFAKRSGAVEIGDDGLADAEAALEAMSSFRLAEGALQRNDLVTAEQHASAAVSGDPSQLDYVSLLGWIRAARGAPIEEAIRTMSKVLIDDPSNERALFYRAKLLVRTNRFPEAMHDLDELLATNPNHREGQAEARQLRARTQ